MDPLRMVARKASSWRRFKLASPRMASIIMIANDTH
jgi:hypothetical protein